MTTGYEKYIDILKGRLKPRRFNHSLEVAKEAKRLAVLYGADAEKAYLAGLLHDITKNETRDAQLQLFKQFGIILTDIEMNAEKLWHAITGAKYIENILKIEDKDIITAVRYHTTARAGMSLFEKIIYIADYTSADRDYDGADKMRELSNIGLDKAMEFALEFTVTDLATRRLPIHPDTIDAYNEVFLRKEEA